ncbi:hypothetical protein DVH05_003937 [Phytophthora capsici]|nr:hypothetical protein DVH05_003937 [Phytophthora capsici]
MSATGWEDVEEPDIYHYMMTPYDPVDNSTSYSGLRQGYSGFSAGAEVIRRGDSPVAFILLLVRTSIVVRCYHFALMRHTNAIGGNKG